MSKKAKPNSIKTGQSVASQASSVLQNPNAGAKAKSIAASALTNAKKKTK